jgi:hypothetical protein
MSGIKRILDDVIATLDELTDNGYGAAFVAIPMAAEILEMSQEDVATVYYNYWSQSHTSD